MFDTLLIEINVCIFYSRFQGFFDIVVKATDNGDEPLFTEVPVKFDTRFGIHSNSPSSLQSEYRYEEFYFNNVSIFS